MFSSNTAASIYEVNLVDDDGLDIHLHTNEQNWLAYSVSQADGQFVLFLHLWQVFVQYNVQHSARLSTQRVFLISCQIDKEERMVTSLVGQYKTEKNILTVSVVNSAKISRVSKVNRRESWDENFLGWNIAFSVAET